MDCLEKHLQLQCSKRYPGLTIFVISNFIVAVWKITMIANPVVGDKITCYYWHISCVACRSVCNGQSEMSVEPLNGGGGNIGWGAVWGESQTLNPHFQYAWVGIKYCFRKWPLKQVWLFPYYCSCCTWVDFALFWHWCSVAGGCVLLQGDRVKVEEGLQISVVGHCCLFWKCFSICGSIRVSSSFLPSPVRSTWGSPRISTICATLAYTSPGVHKSWHT